MISIDTIKIRMYHTGSVGDCFLLLFQKAGVTTFSMLIDCGGFQTKKDAICKCVEDIRKSIVDDTIDLVVVTHEHLDHVSGFNQARHIFDKIKFKQVWMSWAENAADPLARKLLKEKGKKIKALQAVLTTNLAKIKSNMRATPRQVGYRHSLRLRGEHFMRALEILEIEDSASLVSPGVRLKIGDAMKYIKEKCPVKERKDMYRKPGDVIRNLKGAEGVKIHILGPPYHSDLHGIKNDMDHDEMYSLAKRLGMKMENFRYNAMASRLDPDIPLISPFHPRYCMNDAEEKKFNRTWYNARQNRWRQIEYDWLDEAGELAIALTDYVNNTSLAMALELESTGKVLLFPADAQSGNWLSWHDEELNRNLVRNGGKKVAGLLENTIFYKVGHHGSHNGTASESGLEKMTAQKMIAFMPLVQDKVPDAWGGSKNFPAKALYKRLIEKTNGAIIRTDTGLINDKMARTLLEKHYSKTEIRKMKDASRNGLYHEWEISV